MKHCSCSASLRALDFSTSPTPEVGQSSCLSFPSPPTAIAFSVLQVAAVYQSQSGLFAYGTRVFPKAVLSGKHVRGLFRPLVPKCILSGNDGCSTRFLTLPRCRFEFPYQILVNSFFVVPHLPFLWCNPTTTTSERDDDLFKLSFILRDRRTMSLVHHPQQRRFSNNSWTPTLGAGYRSHTPRVLRKSASGQRSICSSAGTVMVIGGLFLERSF